MVVRVSSRGIVNIVNMIQEWLIPALTMAREDAEFVGREILRQASDYVKPHPLSFMLESDYIPVITEDTKSGEGEVQSRSSRNRQEADSGPILSR